MKKQFIAILSAFLILMAGFGMGVVAAESAGDNSTNIETTVDVSEANPIVADDDSNVADDGSTVIDTTITNSDDDSTYVSDDDTNITDITVLENSTQKTDNSYKYTDNSTTTQVNVDNSKNMNVSFTDNSVVNNINFISKDSGNTKIIVQDVKDEETLETLPAGNIYKSFNIFIDNVEVANNIENAAVDFKVEKTWLVENDLDSSAIVLNMYESGKWVEVPITITGEDSQYVYFNAEVSEYSTFAISSKTVTVDKILKESDSQGNASQGNNSSEEEIDESTKNVIIKLLELVIELLKGE
jgi:PGF-pre-PGF domain-containing protein